MTCESRTTSAIIKSTIPHPTALDHPLLLPLESSIWTRPFLMHRVHHKILGQGKWVWVDERGVHKDKPLWVGGGGGFQGNGTGNGNVGGGGQVAPHSDKEVKMFEMAQLNVFNRVIKKGGVQHFRCLCSCWQAMGLRGVHTAQRRWERRGRRSWGLADSTRWRPTRGRMLDWCTASPPAPNPRLLATPQPVAPRIRTPATPGTPSPSPQGQSAPRSRRAASYAVCVLVLI